MKTIQFDFTKTCGKIKPMNAVNNGPHLSKADQVRENFTAYKAARLPYARTHDSSYYWYHTIDIHCIFPNFDADVDDPASYDFFLTDEYLRHIEAAGTEVFFRLGESIEHPSKKYYTLPPKDFEKWAQICEHVIRHCTEGWADGMQMKITYWEIWNEPDLDPDDSKNKRTWGGTKAQFFDLYEITAKHLKKCFPHLKIGGPAIAGNMEWGEDFLREMQKRNVPMDFFSWHRYGDCPEQFIKRGEIARNLMDQYGYVHAESILNEWNYVRGWTDEWVYSLKAMNGMKGASLVTSVMATSQYAPIDMLMYYDARPSAMNGMFDFHSLERGYVYYPMYAFSDLAELGTAVQVEQGESLYGVGAVGEHGCGALFTHYKDDDNTLACQTMVEIILPEQDGDMCVELYLLDKDHNLELIRTVQCRAGKISFDVSMKLFDVCYISVKKI